MVVLTTVPARRLLRYVGVYTLKLIYELHPSLPRSHGVRIVVFVSPYSLN